MMLWVELLIAGFVFYEAVLISIHKLLQKENPEMVIWVILGSKIIKMLLTIGVIFIVPRVTDIPMKTFALVTVGIYLITIIIESIFFLKKKQ